MQKLRILFFITIIQALKIYSKVKYLNNYEFLYEIKPLGFIFQLLFSFLIIVRNDNKK